MAVVAVVVFFAAYILMATERVPKMVTALAGAGVILAFGVASSEDAFYSHETGIDWDVIFLLLGMMIIVGILRQGYSSTSPFGRQSALRVHRFA